MNGFTTIENNYIGTDATGTGPLGNNDYGIMFDSAEGEIIDNVISSNAYYGIHIDGPYADAFVPYVTIYGNYIGTDSGATLNLGNGFGGINVQGDCYDMIIGGTQFGEPNTIVNNNGAGIVVKGYDITIHANYIYDNSGLGIDLGVAGPDGITANDPNDGDSGPNDFLNYPVINSMFYNSGSLTYDFDLDCSCRRNRRISNCLL